MSIEITVTTTDALDLLEELEMAEEARQSGSEGLVGSDVGFVSPEAPTNIRLLRETLQEVLQRQGVELGYRTRLRLRREKESK